MSPTRANNVGYVRFPRNSRIHAARNESLSSTPRIIHLNACDIPYRHPILLQVLHEKEVRRGTPHISDLLASQIRSRPNFGSCYYRVSAERFVENKNDLSP